MSLLNSFEYNKYQKIVKTNFKNGIISIIIILFFFIIAYFFKKISMYYIKQNDKNNKNNKKELLYIFIIDVIYYCILVIGIIYGLSNIGVDVKTIFILFSSVGLALALAVQSTFSQIVSGLIIIFYNYFNYGDLIQMDDNTMGFIKKFNLLYTTIYDIRKVETIIPNNLLLKGNFTNLYASDEIYMTYNVRLSNNNSIDYDILLLNLKNELINNCSYIVDKKNVYVYISNMSSYGTELLIKFLIKSHDYYQALFSSTFLVRKLLADENILLLDNSYLDTPNDTNLELGSEQEFNEETQ
jgi:small-conductance mechanosensitive channel